MENLYTLKFRFVMLFGFLFLALGLFTNVNSQSFSQNGINFNGKGSLQNGTSLTFGPDGRLYVTEYTGSIKIFTIERIGPGNYSVISMEELKGIQSIQDHNDDGTLHTSQFRETIGLAATGTAANPVIYVSSSDFRIGGGKWKCAFHVPRALLQIYKTLQATVKRNEMDVVQNDLMLRISERS